LNVGWFWFDINFSQTLRGMTLDEAPESTIQLWTFLLKISKVIRKGGVVDLDLCPVREALVATWILGEVSLVNELVLTVPFLAPTFISFELVGFFLVGS
jgi:hypothetical protein